MGKQWSLCREGVLLGLEAILVDLLDDPPDRSTEPHTSGDLQPLGVAIAHRRRMSLMTSS